MIRKTKWASAGDFNAFFALFLDNIINLVILSEILQYGFGFPSEVISKYMIPGTAFGVMFGDLVYSWFGIRLAKKTGRSDVTAMPLGLDTPSTIGMAVAVLGPAFLHLKSTGMDEYNAAITTWHIGMGTMLWMGIVKIITSFMGTFLQKMIPTAALLGSLAGIGLVWLSANSMIHIYEIPFVGILSLGIILFTLMARFDFPFKLPGAAMAVIFGCAIYYGLGFSGLIGTEFSSPRFQKLAFLPALPTLAGFRAMFGEALAYLPVAIPFGIMTIVGGINVTEGAKLAGDEYKTRDILLTEALATLAAGITGGVSQSTPYIGHSAYKSMGARSAYTIATGLAVGIGGMLGVVQFIVQLIPNAAVAPILVFIGFEITTLAFRVSPHRHAMAVAFAIVPSVLNFGHVKLKLLYEAVQRTSLEMTARLGDIAVPASAELIKKMNGIIPPNIAGEYIILGALSQGFILTSMIWSACVAFLIDRKIVQAATTMFIASILTMFGMIHSVFPNGDLYLPWTLRDSAAMKHVILTDRSFLIPYEFSLAYVVAGLLILAMFFFGPAKNQHPSHEH